MAFARWLDMADGTEPFFERGSYRSVYDIIVELPFYRRAMNFHMSWIRSIQTPRPLIVEAGGGTGIMNAEARRVRRDADIYLLDINPAMAEQAQRRGVPNKTILIADITAMSIKSSLVDHMFSHSVLWAVAHPDAFFSEAQRVLTPCGTLAISTVGENLQRYRESFIDYLHEHLSAAVLRGAISPHQKTIFVEQNRRIIEGAVSPVSLKQLGELGARHRLDLARAVGCYVILTPEGPRPYFHQVLYRKRGPWESR